MSAQTRAAAACRRTAAASGRAFIAHPSAQWWAAYWSPKHQAALKKQKAARMRARAARARARAKAAASAKRRGLPALPKRSAAWWAAWDKRHPQPACKPPRPVRPKPKAPRKPPRGASAAPPLRAARSVRPSGAATRPGKPRPRR